jgi:hypothetical protein
MSFRYTLTLWRPLHPLRIAYFEGNGWYNVAVVELAQWGMKYLTEWEWCGKIIGNPGRRLKESLKKH